MELIQIFSNFQFCENELKDQDKTALNVNINNEQQIKCQSEYKKDNNDDDNGEYVIKIVNWMKQIMNFGNVQNVHYVILLVIIKM